MTDSKITLRDVYDAIQRVEDKYDRRFEGIEANITKLQEFQNKTLGILGVVSVFISLAATWVWQKLTNS